MTERRGLGLAAVAGAMAVLATGCSPSGSAGTSAPPASPAATAPTQAAQPVILSTAGCTYAMSAVNTITSQGQISLDTGNMGTGVSASGAAAWSTLLGSAGTSITALRHTKRNVRLGFDVVLAELSASTLGIDERPPQSGNTASQAAKLIRGLQKIRRDCTA
jgi:hypothetical protein